MKRDVGNNLWRGSPALITPHRQWIRERMPNGNEGFTVCGDDGFARYFDPTDRADVGRLRLMEWKTSSNGKRPTLDHSTDRLVAAVRQQQPIDVAVVQLVDGNCPGQLSHYPVSMRLASDVLPDPVVVASLIYWNGDLVDESELIDRLSSLRH